MLTRLKLTQEPWFQKFLAMHNAKDLPQNFVPWNPEPVRDDFERLKFFPTKKGETNSFLDKIAKKALKDVRQAFENSEGNSD